VFAETLDGSDVNNANFSAPRDGSNGRMQMYKWVVGNDFEIMAVTLLVTSATNVRITTTIPVCEKCGWEYSGACSTECQQHPQKRENDGTGYYKKELNGYNPYLGLKSKARKSEQN